jgi:hypothetical protein
MKYVLMFVETERFEADLDAMDEAERDRAYARVHHQDNIVPHRKLMPPDSATTVWLDRGEPLIMDGSFAEGKEVLSGYAEIDVAHLDEALRLVRDWPALGHPRRTHARPSRTRRRPHRRPARAGQHHQPAEQPLPRQRLHRT